MMVPSFPETQPVMNIIQVLESKELFKKRCKEINERLAAAEEAEAGAHAAVQDARDEAKAVVAGGGEHVRELMEDATKQIAEGRNVLKLAQKKYSEDVKSWEEGFNERGADVSRRERAVAKAEGQIDTKRKSVEASMQRYQKVKAEFDARHKRIAEADFRRRPTRRRSVIIHQDGVQQSVVRQSEQWNSVHDSGIIDRRHINREFGYFLPTPPLISRSAHLG